MRSGIVAINAANTEIPKLRMFYDLFDKELFENWFFVGFIGSEYFYWGA